MQCTIIQWCKLPDKRSAIRDLSEWIQQQPDACSNGVPEISVCRDPVRPGNDGEDQHGLRGGRGDFGAVGEDRVPVAAALGREVHEVPSGSKLTGSSPETLKVGQPGRPPRHPCWPIHFDCITSVDPSTAFQYESDRARESPHTHARRGWIHPDPTLRLIRQLSQA